MSLGLPPKDCVIMGIEEDCVTIGSRIGPGGNESLGPEQRENPRPLETNGPQKGPARLWGGAKWVEMGPK